MSKNSVFHTVEAIARRLIQHLLALFRIFGFDLYEYRLRTYSSAILTRKADLCICLREDGIGLLFDFSILNSHAQVGRDFLHKIAQTSIPFCIADTHVPGTADEHIPNNEASRIRSYESSKFNQKKVLHFTSTHIASSKMFSVASTPFWEFEDGLIECHPELFKGYDHAVVFSTFCYEAMKRIAPFGFDIRLMRYPLPLTKHQFDRAATRTRFDISRTAFAVLFNFNIHAGFDRKNPLGAIRAFGRAFSNNPDTRLILKVSGSEGREAEILEMRECANDLGIFNQVTVITDSLTHDEILALTGSCDAYLSLHRGEGLGLGMLEAMSVEVPVVATAYGGNTEFTTQETAFLVPYALTPANTRFAAYRHVSKWADPDIDVAARFLKNLYQHPEVGRAKAAAAKHFLANHYSLENFEESVRKLIAEWRT